MRRTWARFSFGCACAATGAIAVAFLIHGTLRDRIAGLAILFYATPWPVIALGAALLAVYWARRGSRAIAGSLAGMAAVALGLWLCLDWRWNRPAGARGELRVVQWNVDRPDWRQEGDMRWLAAQDADVITIAERQPRKKNTLERWRAAFPDYQLVPSAGEMLCLVRGEVLSAEEGSLSGHSFRTLIRTRIQNRELTVLQVDIYGEPTVSRKPPLQALAEMVRQHRSENMIVLGDFNTPMDSILFAPIRAVAANAFAVAGNGCAATWPMPLPVLSLDQIYTTGRLRAVRCEHMVSWRSDHRAVEAEFDFTP